MLFDIISGLNSINIFENQPPIQNSSDIRNLYGWKAIGILIDIRSFWLFFRGLTNLVDLDLSFLTFQDLILYKSLKINLPYNIIHSYTMRTNLQKLLDLLIFYIPIYYIILVWSFSSWFFCNKSAKY